MKKEKRGISNVIVVLLIVFIAILATVFLYGIVIPMIKEKSGDVDVNLLNSNIKFIDNSIILNDKLSRLEFSIRRFGQGNLSYLLAIVGFEGQNKRYNLLDIPENLERRTYLLDITGIMDAKEITLYPIFKNGKAGIGEKMQVKSVGIIDEDLDLIEPIISNNLCISNWKCTEFSKCILNYDLGNLLTNEMVLKGEQTRICDDNSNCNSQIIERKECDDKAEVMLKKVTEDRKNYVEVYDSNNKLISKLEFIPGEHNVLNIELPI